MIGFACVSKTIMHGYTGGCCDLLGGNDLVWISDRLTRLQIQLQTSEDFDFPADSVSDRPRLTFRLVTCRYPPPPPLPLL